MPAPWRLPSPPMTASSSPVDVARGRYRICSRRRLRVGAHPKGARRWLNIASDHGEERSHCDSQADFGWSAPSVAGRAAVSHLLGRSRPDRASGLWMVPMPWHMGQEMRLPPRISTPGGVARWYTCFAPWQRGQVSSVPGQGRVGWGGFRWDRWGIGACYTTRNKVRTKKSQTPQLIVPDQSGNHQAFCRPRSLTVRGHPS